MFEFGRDGPVVPLTVGQGSTEVGTKTLICTVYTYICIAVANPIELTMMCKEQGIYGIR